jgi:MFS family permease
MPFHKSLNFGKIATTNIMLVANAFVWYLLAFNMIRDLLDQSATPFEKIAIIGVNTGAIALSGLAGTFLFGKLKDRQRLLLYWIAVGVMISFAPLGVNVESISNLIIIAALFGVYFGLGMPATMGNHAEIAKIDERAKFGGFAFLIIGIISAVAGLVIFDNLFASCLLLAFVRLLGVAVFYIQRKELSSHKEEEQRVSSYRSILSNKSFLVYFVPWLMFTLINSLLYPIQKPIFEQNNINYTTLMAAEYIITAVFAVISGFIADKLGRKRLAIIGFIMLGIGYAVVGVVPITYLEFSSVLYIFADGVAWGIFYVLFIFTLWGDLAGGTYADKIYFLGALPFVNSYFARELFGALITQNPDLINSPTIIFSFASVFLFLAVLPLVYAPETLPEKVMKDKDLKSYIEDAKKKAAKDAEKTKKTASWDKSLGQFEEKQTEQNEEFEKAKTLAEKYY